MNKPVEKQIVRNIPLWINNKPAAAATTRMGDITNPATGLITAKVPLCNEADVDTAVQLSERAVAGSPRDAGFRARASACRTCARPGRCRSDLCAARVHVFQLRAGVLAGGSPREAVQDKSAHAVGLRDAIRDDADHDHDFHEGECAARDAGCRMEDAR